MVSNKPLKTLFRKVPKETVEILWFMWNRLILLIFGQSLVLPLISKFEKETNPTFIYSIMCQEYLHNYLLILMINPYAVSIYSIFAVVGIWNTERLMPQITTISDRNANQAWQMPKVIFPSFKSTLISIFSTIKVFIMETLQKNIKYGLLVFINTYFSVTI